MAKRKSKAKAQAKATTPNVQARYDAAGYGRRLAGWNTPSSGPNRAITGLQKIRDRARDVARNESSGAANVRVWTTNIVGTGIIPRPITKNVSLKEKLTLLWDEWTKSADADGVLDFYGLQALVVRTWFMSGEAFVRFRPRRLTDGLVVPLQIQVLEADMLPLLDADAYPGMPESHYIRQGIEFDRIGRRIAYWMYRTHPGDHYQVDGFTASDLVRVPAASILHIYEPLRPGQLRGVSEMASVITKLRNVADFDDAVLERQKLANLFTMFVIKPLPAGANDPMTGLPYKGNLNDPIAGLEPGISQELLPGEDVRFSEPPDAGAGYADFMRTQNLGVTAGMGTPYELATGDIANVSDRTLRVIVNEFRRLAEHRQWLIFIPQMCQPIRDVWANMALIAGALTQSEADDARRVRWSPQGWTYMHPVQDVQAKALEVEHGFRSRSSVIAERGDDPDEVDQEREDDIARAERHGLNPVIAPENGDENAEPADDKDDKDDDEEQRATNNEIQKRILAMLTENPDD